MIAHIVLFDPKPSLSDSEKRLFAQSVLAVTSRLPSVCRVSIGRKIAVDPGYGRSFGDKPYEYSAILEFQDREALVSYLVAPEHAELGRLFWESCARTIIAETEAVDLSDASSIDKLVL